MRTENQPVVNESGIEIKQLYTAEDVEAREAVLVGRLVNMRGRYGGVEVKSAEREGDRDARIMRCTIIFRGDRYATFWRSVYEDGSHWILVSADADGVIYSAEVGPRAVKRYVRYIDP